MKTKLFLFIIGLFILQVSFSQQRIKDDLIISGDLEVLGNTLSANNIYADTIYIDNIYSDNGLKVDGDSLNFKNLGIIFENVITNKEYRAGNNYSDIMLHDVYAGIGYGNGTLRSKLIAYPGHAQVEARNTSGDNYSFDVFENKAFFILNETDTMYKFNIDSLLAPLIAAKFKEIVAEKAILDTIINDNDTAANGFMPIKYVIETEKFDSINVRKIINDTLYHAYTGCEDSTIIITFAAADTWYQVTNSVNNMFSELSVRGFSSTNDTLYNKMKGKFRGIVCIDFQGTTGYWTEFRIKNAKTGVQLGVKRRVTPTGNYDQVCIPWYGNLNKNDGIIVEIKNVGGTTNVTIRNISFEAYYIQKNF